MPLLVSVTVAPVTAAPVLSRSAPTTDAVSNCAQAGVLGALAGTLGALQATEVVKEILGIGRSLSGRLVMYDALAGTFDEMAVAKRADCPTCGAA